MPENTLKEYARNAYTRFSSLSRKAQVTRVVFGLLLIAGLIICVFAYRQIRYGTEREIFAQAHQADTVIVHVDNTLTAGLTATSPQEIADVIGELKVAQRQVDKASVSAQKLRKKARKSEVARIERIQNSLGVRTYLLAVAAELLQENKAAAQSLLFSKKSYVALKKGIMTAREAQKLARSSTPSDQQRFNTLVADSSQSFEEAQSALDAAKGEYPSADFNAYQTYIGACLQLNELSLSAHRAFVKKDNKATHDAINKYNDSSRTAAVLAREKVKPLNEVIMMAYKGKTEGLATQYISAREKVSIIDRQLR